MSRTSKHAKANEKGQNVLPLKRDLVFVYSADRDLAASLAMLLEDSVTVVMETDRKKMVEGVRAMLPSVVLIDLPSAPGESLRQLSVLEAIPVGIPVVLLRNYGGSVDIEREILKLKAYVFFKPFDVNKLRELIGTLLATRTNTHSYEGGAYEAIGDE